MSKKIQLESVYIVRDETDSIIAVVTKEDKYMKMYETSLVGYDDMGSVLTKLSE